jgi:hypothetical protein
MVNGEVIKMKEEKQVKFMTVIEEQPDGSLTTCCIDLHDVDYIESENRRLVYYIGEKRYLQITKLHDMDTVLDETDGFVSLDRTNLVNLRKVKDYDEKLGKVYFTESAEGKSVFATIAKIKQRVFSPLIQRAIAKNSDLQLTKKFEKTKQKHAMKQQETE